MPESSARHFSKAAFLRKFLEQKVVKEVSGDEAVEAGEKEEPAGNLQTLSALPEFSTKKVSSGKFSTGSTQPETELDPESG